MKYNENGISNIGEVLKCIIVSFIEPKVLSPRKPEFRFRNKTFAPILSGFEILGSTASKITAKESTHPIVFMHFTASTVSFKKMQSKKGKQDVIKKIGFLLLSDSEKIAPASRIENKQKNLSML